MVDFKATLVKDSVINRYTPPPQGLCAVIHTDGSCPENPGPMGIGYHIAISDKPPILVGTRFTPGSNNRAEYLALIWALRHALRLGVTHAEVFSDSKLMVQQVGGSWEVRDGLLKRFHEEATGLVRMFTFLELSHIPRADNDASDYLSKHPTTTQEQPGEIEINLKGPRTRKLTRQQAAMIRWWWTTHRCQNEYRLARIFNGTPSHMGKIGRGESYKDVMPLDLPHEETGRAIQFGIPSP
jgi:ribonuclease HI